MVTEKIDFYSPTLVILSLIKAESCKIVRQGKLLAVLDGPFV